MSTRSASGAAAAVSQAQVINTLAGNGTPGHGGDGGVASNASLNAPSGLAEDGAGNLYIADTANNCIRKVAVGTGAISTFAGNANAGFAGDGGPAASAELDAPVGITFDSTGNLYIADTGNQVVREVSSSGTITTVAGSHATGYSGDGGTATSATLYSPTSVVLDSAGNLYIADAGNNRIRQVNAAGTIITFAGNGTAGYSGNGSAATAAELNNPSALAEDSKGNLYIADTGNHAIRMINSSGVITTVAGTGSAGYNGDGGQATSGALHSPAGVTLVSAGALYIAEGGNNVVRMVTTAGVMTTLAGNGSSGFSGDGGLPQNASLDNPHGLVFDANGNLCISDQGNNRVRELDAPAGSVIFPTTSVGATSTATTMALEINAPGTTLTSVTVPVSQSGSQEYSVTSTGCALNTALDAGTLCNVAVTFTPAYPGSRPTPLQITTSAATMFSFGMIGVGAAPQAALTPGVITTIPSTLVGSLAGPDSPFTVAFGYFSSLTGSTIVDSAGNLYLALDAPEGMIQTGAVAKVTPAGTVSALFNQAAFGLMGLALDSAGNVYAAATGASCVEKISASGVATTVAGFCYEYYNDVGASGFGGDGGLATAALLNGPASVAVDAAGNVYIADTNNNRIRKVTAATGIINTIVGNGTAGFSGDGDPAANAELNDPKSVALDAAGNLYIADDGNNRIRKVAVANSIITTIAGNGTAGDLGDNGPALEAELNQPTSLAIDGAGDLYLADSVDSTVRMINAEGTITTVAGGGTQTGDGVSATSASINVLGVAVGSTGNLYISDGSAVRNVNVSQSSLSFGNVQVGAPATQTVQVTDTGNAPLLFTAPASGMNPNIPAGFTQDSNGTCPQVNPGSQPAPLGAGASCSLVVDFAPATATAQSGTATIADNSLGTSAMQSILLSATGTTAGTTTTISVATPTYGSTAVSATILATSGSLVPVGSVVFVVDGATQPPITVNSSGAATLPSTVSNALAVGSHTIDATYTSSSAGFSGSLATRIFSVSPAPPSIGIAAGNTSLTVTAGSSVTDTLTITPAGGYTGALQLSCSGLPENATCSFQPATVTLTSSSGAQATMLTIQTAGNGAENRSLLPRDNSMRPAAVFWGLFLLGAGRRRPRLTRGKGAVAVLAWIICVCALSGCGQGGGSTAKTTPPSPVTPPGTSTVTVTASASGSTVQIVTLKLTVQ
ncbi:MAG: choice-of-anchor D domain-containing protein [Acidobacteriaceae bacterium]